MREYSFVSVSFERRRDGLALRQNYHDIIREQAAAGWEFLQAISFESHADPHIDLVFSRKVNE